MLLISVIIYWMISIAIGLYASRYVKNSRDFAIAGRHLPFYMVVATVFATWFGSEVVLGIPSVFIKEGLKGIVADPFGSSLCLILVGLVIAAPLYRLNLLTIGDYYRLRYGRETELITSIAIVISYLGWVGAQISALGLVFNVVSDQAISREVGMIVGAATILIYTYYGGMWAVAITDLLQMSVIVVGMLFISSHVADLTGGVTIVINHAAAADKLNLLPSWDYKEIIAFSAALVTMMFGSMPQQDVFQRVQSSKTIKIAVWGSVVGGVLYFLFSFVPMFLGYSANIIAPQLVVQLQEVDTQLILPNFIKSYSPLWLQILFFGALLSAIKSCASATLLAPSVTFSENILRPFLKEIDDVKFLKLMRLVTLCFTILVTLYALNSKSSIFKMVENAYQITLVAAFVPLIAGLYWKKANRQGALFSIAGGLLTWIYGLIFFAEEALMPPHFAGLLAAISGMIVGSLIPSYLVDNNSLKTS